MKPSRVMFDTSVYEFLFLRHLDNLGKKVELGEIAIYGCSVVRKELREIPKSVKHEGRSFRNSLLSVYDKVAGKHSYPVEGVVEFTAEQYWKEYNGGISKRKLMNDFRIVAVSSMHNLDIIVSEDNHSMKSAPAIMAYMKVNEKNGFRTPRFYSINDLFP
jgi:hypothetical protein